MVYQLFLARWTHASWVCYGHQLGAPGNWPNCRRGNGKDHGKGRISECRAVGRFPGFSEKPVGTEWPSHQSTRTIHSAHIGGVLHIFGKPSSKGLQFLRKQGMKNSGHREIVFYNGPTFFVVSQSRTQRCVATGTHFVGLEIKSFCVAWRLNQTLTYAWTSS
jgi:hypothetical protein